MNRNFARALALVLKEEGGFSNDPRDPGGATNKGITIATFHLYVDATGSVDDLKHITDAQVATVYRKQYWEKLSADLLPDGVDYAVFDFGVNSGPDRAAKYLQAIAGVPQDGAIGPKTISALSLLSREAVITDLCANRLSYLKRLDNWTVYGKGWAGRVKRVNAAAITMSRAAAALPTAPFPPVVPAPVPPVVVSAPPVIAPQPSIPAASSPEKPPLVTAPAPPVQSKDKRTALAGVVLVVAAGVAGTWHHLVDLFWSIF